MRGVGFTGAIAVPSAVVRVTVSADGTVPTVVPTMAPPPPLTRDVSRIRCRTEAKADSSPPAPPCPSSSSSSAPGPLGRPEDTESVAMAAVHSSSRMADSMRRSSGAPALTLPLGRLGRSEKHRARSSLRSAVRSERASAAAPPSPPALAPAPPAAVRFVRAWRGGVTPCDPSDSWLQRPPRPPASLAKPVIAPAVAAAPPPVPAPLRLAGSFSPCAAACPRRGRGAPPSCSPLRNLDGGAARAAAAPHIRARGEQRGGDRLQEGARGPHPAA